MAESNRRGEDAAEHVADVFDDAVDDDAVAEGKGAAVKEKVRPEKAEGVGFVGRLGRFVREVVAELRKVIWPTRNELLTYAAVVIVFVTVMTTIVALLDLAYAKGVLIVFGNPK